MGKSGRRVLEHCEVGTGLRVEGGFSFGSHFFHHYVLVFLMLQHWAQQLPAMLENQTLATLKILVKIYYNNSFLSYYQAFLAIK